MVFGNDQQVSGIPPSVPEKESTALMQHAWAAFADDPTHGLEKLGWPVYDSEEQSLVLLAYNNSPKVVLTNPSVCDLPCSTVTLGADQTAA
jgi:cholinesterase